MAIEAGIRRSYAVRLIVIGIVCGVLGAWGVYDYVVAIPRKQVMFERAELLRKCRAALETEQAAGTFSPDSKNAYEAALAERNRVLQPLLDSVHKERTSFSSQEELEAMIKELGTDLSKAIESSPDAQWIGLLGTIMNGLPVERRLPLLNYPVAQQAFEAAQTGIDQLGKVTAPSRFDRATQWAFILCLPCVPYFFWVYAATKRRSYRLDDQGALQAPEGTWTAPDIADIDMSRWMAKSIAWLVLRDGTRIKLDDYRFRNLHLIVGSIAARLRPDEWDAEAKPLGKDRGEAAAAVAGEIVAGSDNAGAAGGP